MDVLLLFILGDNTVHRLRGLYNRLHEYPELFDSRLAGASRPPDFAVTNEELLQPLAPSSWLLMSGVHDPISMTDYVTREKRKLELPLAESCPSVTEWITFNKSKDIHDNEVEIFQVHMHAACFVSLL